MLRTRKQGPVGVGPEKGHENDLRTRTPFIKAETLGVGQPGEDSAPERLYCRLSFI